MWGAAGERWLADLPGLFDAVLAEWELRPGEPYPLSFNWVCPVRRADGSPAVLKLGVPASDHLVDEASALRAFGGRGAVRLLARDADRGALLLEHARPGTLLRELVPGQDEAATAAVVGVLRRLHSAPVEGVTLPPVSQLTEDFAQHLSERPDTAGLPRRMVERAAGLFAELCDDAWPPVVVHGDAHHDNLVRAEREPWLAIDPHGRVGDPGSEIAPVLYNPDPWLRDDALLKLVPARVEQLADGLGIPLDRAIAWGYAGSVLSEVWTAEGGGRPEGRPLDVARLLERRLS